MRHLNVNFLYSSYYYAQCIKFRVNISRIGVRKKWHYYIRKFYRKVIYKIKGKHSLIVYVSQRTYIFDKSKAFRRYPLRVFYSTK